MSSEIREEQFAPLQLAPYEEVTGLLKFIECRDDYLYLELPSGKYRIETGSFELATTPDEIEEDELAIVSILSTPNSEKPIRVIMESIGRNEVPTQDSL